MKLFYEENDLISQNQFNNHLQLYEGYIKKVNNINTKMQDKIINDDVITWTYRDMQYALNGVILHELYFENIKINDSKNIYWSLDIFKNGMQYSNWKKEFTTMALQTRGWLIYAYEPRIKQFCNMTLQAHDEGFVCYAKPIIVLDMYEHAYYTDYINDKNKYITQFLNNIDWTVAKNRVKKAIKEANI